MSPVEQVWQSYCPNEECGWKDEWVTRDTAKAALARHMKETHGYVASRYPASWASTPEAGGDAR